MERGIIMTFFDKNNEGNDQTKLCIIVMSGFIIAVSIVMYSLIVIEGM